MARNLSKKRKKPPLRVVTHVELRTNESARSPVTCQLRSRLPTSRMELFFGGLCPGCTRIGEPNEYEAFRLASRCSVDNHCSSFHDELAGGYWRVFLKDFLDSKVVIAFNQL